MLTCTSPKSVIVVVPKSEVKEISIQTDEWKPQAPVPMDAVISAAPVQSVKSAIAAAPDLYRVGSITSHQF